MYPGHLKKIVDRYITALNAHDMAAVLEIYDADATLEDPVGTEPRCGMSQIRELYEIAFAQNVTARLNGDVRIAANFAAFPFAVALRPEGRAFKLEVIDVFEFNDRGKVIAQKAYWGPENLSRL
jgi:steroid delta-isomerase